MPFESLGKPASLRAYREKPYFDPLSGRIQQSDRAALPDEPNKFQAFLNYLLEGGSPDVNELGMPGGVPRALRGVAKWTSRPGVGPWGVETPGKTAEGSLLERLGKFIEAHARGRYQPRNREDVAQAAWTEALARLERLPEDMPEAARFKALSSTARGAMAQFTQRTRVVPEPPDVVKQRAKLGRAERLWANIAARKGESTSPSDEALARATKLPLDTVRQLRANPAPEGVAIEEPRALDTILYKTGGKEISQPALSLEDLQLTPNQLAIAKLWASGESTAKIARKLGVSKPAVVQALGRLKKRGARQAGSLPPISGGSDAPTGPSNARPAGFDLDRLVNDYARFVMGKAPTEPREVDPRMLRQFEGGMLRQNQPLTRSDREALAAGYSWRDLEAREGLTAQAFEDVDKTLIRARYATLREFGENIPGMPILQASPESRPQAILGIKIDEWHPSVQRRRWNMRETDR